MTDQETLDKYINLEKALFDGERKEIGIEMYKYKEVISVRDEIGTCPNIEVEIDVTDKSQFFIRPYLVNEEDMTLINKEMKQLFI